MHIVYTMFSEASFVLSLEFLEFYNSNFLEKTYDVLKYVNLPTNRTILVESDELLTPHQKLKL